MRIPLGFAVSAAATTGDDAELDVDGLRGMSATTAASVSPTTPSTTAARSLGFCSTAGVVLERDTSSGAVLSVGAPGFELILGGSVGMTFPSGVRVGAVAGAVMGDDFGVVEACAAKNCSVGKR